MKAMFFLKNCTGNDAGRSHEQKHRKITTRLLFCIQYLDEKFDNDYNFIQRNTGNCNFFKKSAKAGDFLAKQEIGRLRQEFSWEGWKKWNKSVN